MTYKTRMCYVLMRRTTDPDTGEQKDDLPVAVFYDQETAEGNSEAYNMEMKEREIEGITFYVTMTASHE